jgi:hypothetical protein
VELFCDPARSPCHCEDVEHFHKYLYGQEFYMLTDHSDLTWLMNFKNLEGQTARCAQRLQEYKFTSEHRQGRKHKNADAPSRRPCHALTQGRVKGRYKANTIYFSTTRSLLGSSGSEYGTAKPHRHRAHSAGSRNRTTTGVERHRRPESHIQKLLGPVEIARCKKRRT